MTKEEKKRKGTGKRQRRKQKNERERKKEQPMSRNANLELSKWAEQKKTQERKALIKSLKDIESNRKLSQDFSQCFDSATKSLFPFLLLFSPCLASLMYNGVGLATRAFFPFFARFQSMFLCPFDLCCSNF